MRSLLVGVLVVAAVTGSVLWLVDSGDDEEPEQVLVDEGAGRLRGVSFGDTVAEIRARLGEPTDDADGVFPEGAEFTGPPAIPSPASDQASRVPPNNLHYGDTAYLVSPTVGVFSMAILADGARTRAGIGVGDELERVRERYERVECGKAPAGEYPWCRAIVGDVRVFFGADPIESITLTRYEPTGG